MFCALTFVFHRESFSLREFGVSNLLNFTLWCLGTLVQCLLQNRKKDLLAEFASNSTCTQRTSTTSGKGISNLTNGVIFTQKTSSKVTQEGSRDVGVRLTL